MRCASGNSARRAASSCDPYRSPSLRTVSQRHRVATAALLALFGVACRGEEQAPPRRDSTVAPREVPHAELSLARDRSTLLDSADALIRRDSSVGLVTVDASGRPRVRSVRAFRLVNPASDRERFTVFVLTRLSTRKVEQLAANAAATLYFNEDQRAAYATLMGRAIVHRDPTLARLRPFLDSATVKFFWPAFPEDFVVLEIVPQWIEFIGPGLWNDPGSWRPQAVVF